ncbi:MAG TPA: hypothetical protein GX707_15005 [Epulopiscium sp.]|nr:hypothetical protein [Candidatus Epulonipiscium sp.]
MKALILWDSYFSSVIIAEVEKETDQEILAKYRQPELMYKITKKLLDCKSSEVKYEDIVDMRQMYIGHTYLMESYVYPITEQQAIDIIATYEPEADKEERDFKVKLEEIRKHQEDVLKKAIEKGEKQVLSKRMVECNDPYAECNWDIIIEYLYPDGSFEEERYHSY